ncbi:MAG: hypothetical protein EOO03_13765 [Chitinophagaceae bacterium]|nr:MAG: hypothetical protein EOO03_13765 [Chitinophagaceae bacterium]
MNYWKHSLLSKKKFGGAAEDYLHIHKFMDASKLFYFDVKHRVLLHNTYGIEICIQKFGDKLTNSAGQTILVRDIAAEHCKEDLMGVVPTLNNWFKYVDEDLAQSIVPINPTDPTLKEFVLRPYIMSGIKSTLIITQSNFGVYLAKEILGIEYALELAKYLNQAHINELLQGIKLRDRWQYKPDLQQLNLITDELT